MFSLKALYKFLSLNGKTSQQKAHSLLAIAKFSMTSGTCNVFVRYKICTMQNTWSKALNFHSNVFLPV